MNALVRPYGLNDIADCIFDDDFMVTMPSSFWTSVSGNSGTMTIGITTMNTGSNDLYTGAGASNNDEVYAYGLKVIALKAGAAFAVAFDLSYAEANTDDCNICFGLTKTAPIAGFLVDGNGGVNSIANDDGFYFEKKGNTTVWNGLTQWSAASFSQRNVSRDSSIFTGRQVGIIEVRAFPNLVAEVTFRIAFVPSGGIPEPLTDITGLVPLPIRHRFAFTSSTALMPVMGVKTGGAHAETVSFDRVSAFSLRA